MVENSETRVFEKGRIPALQVPYFGSQVLHCLHNGEERKEFEWEVPTDTFVSGFVQDQAGNHGLTADYAGKFMFLSGLGYIEDGLYTLDEVLDEFDKKTYCNTFFTNAKYNGGGEHMENGKRGGTHDIEAQKYLLDSQKYRGFYDFDEQVWELIGEIMKDAKKMKQDGLGDEEIITFLENNIIENILSKYEEFIRARSINGPKDNEFTISYTPTGRIVKTLILRVRNIPYEDYNNYLSNY